MKNDNKYDNTGYGPILELLEKEIGPYIRISEKAFRYFIETFSNKVFLLRSKSNLILNNLLSNAKNTSFSIRLLSTMAQPIEGYALLRIRLEQLIIASYLINEKSEIGIEPFKKHYPVIEYNLLKANDNNDNLKLALSYFLPKLGNEYNSRMDELKKQIESSYEVKDGDYKRKWTKLYINQLAEHRDRLITLKNELSKIKLIDYYNTIYKISSSIVHSDVASITENFITIHSNGNLMPQPLYVFSNLITLAMFDILQCYETAKYMKLNLDDKYDSLYDNYLNQVKKDFT